VIPLACHQARREGAAIRLIRKPEDLPSDYRFGEMVNPQAKFSLEDFFLEYRQKD
jgi:hypothetical protein